MAYAVGIAKPLTLLVVTYGTEQDDLTEVGETNVVRPPEMQQGRQPPCCHHGDDCLGFVHPKRDLFHRGGEGGGF